MPSQRTSSHPGRGGPIRRRCRRCRCWVLTGVLVAGDCPTCTGLQALPLVDSTGRPIRPHTVPVSLPADVTTADATDYPRGGAA
jgi:hypothetical protein